MTVMVKAIKKHWMTWVISIGTAAVTAIGVISTTSFAAGESTAALLHKVSDNTEGREHTTEWKSSVSAVIAALKTDQRVLQVQTQAVINTANKNAEYIAKLADAVIELTATTSKLDGTVGGLKTLLENMK